MHACEVHMSALMWKLKKWHMAVVMLCKDSCFQTAYLQMKYALCA
jgi:hypothetical protein